MFMFAAWAVALARHFHGKRLIRQCRRMHTLFLKSSRVAVERTKLRGHAMTGIAIGALACCFDPWICSAIALSLLGYTCVAATKIYLPATVLYLATSTPSRLLFLHRLQRRVPNVTAMLDASNLPPEGTEGYSPTPNFHSMFDSRTMTQTGTRFSRPSLTLRQPCCSTHGTFRRACFMKSNRFFRARYTEKPYSSLAKRGRFLRSNTWTSPKASLIP
jgi:hypothetical protein